MFTTAQQVIDYVTVRTRRNYGLSDFKAYMEHMDNPQYRLACIHIGGTNGKGSTTDFLRSILQTQGYKVGTFTSPHLESHNDRIRINDVPISDEDLVAYANRYMDGWEEYGLTMFEIDVFLCCMYFMDHQVDYALFEVGLGGELDATNIIDPLVSIITSIGYDHMDYLGDTIEDIAKAKAGIVKKHRPLITHERKPSCLDVFSKMCEACDSKMFLVKDAQHVKVEQQHIFFDYEQYSQLMLSTNALYQVENASNALEVVLYLRTIGVEISDASIYAGLASSKWKGRFEHISNHPDVYLDGAHNEHGMRALIATLQAMHQPLTILFTALRDKETDKMLEMLLSVSDDVIVTEFDFYRAKAAKDLAHDYPVRVIENWQEAVEYVCTHNQGTVIITGSLYFISDVRAYFRRKGVIV